MPSYSTRAASALKIHRTRTLTGAAALLAIAVACTDDASTIAPTASLTVEAQQEGTIYGPVVPLAGGNARTYVTVQNGTPVELGVELNEGTLQGLPAAAAHTGGHQHHQRDLAWELPLPSVAGVTAYKSVNIGWVPNGHQPPYDRPHIDFHFYTITAAERAEIDTGNPDWVQKSGSFPSPAFWPARYYPQSVLVGAPPQFVAVPRMGMHWLDVASPELHGAEFTHTFFYGSWDGKMIFAEPMITRALLESRATVDLPLPPAASYAPDGLHARGYRVYYDASRQRHRVALTNLTPA